MTSFMSKQVQKLPTITKVTDWNLITPAIYWVGEKLAHDIMVGGKFLNHLLFNNRVGIVNKLKEFDVI